MKVLDFFAGIGGFSLAAHWMGWETVAFVEWDEFNQKILAKNFPGVPIHSDIRNYKGERYAADIICGGFPCQPFSSAGKRKGTDDNRYLWPDMFRVVREVQPSWVIGENVDGIYTMDGGAVFEKVCTDLESEGYKVQPLRIPALATGAPHRRNRWWFIANKPGRHTEPGINSFDSRYTSTGAIGRNIPEQEGAERIPKQHGMAKPGESNQTRVIADAESLKDNASATGGFQPEYCNGDQWNIHWYEAATGLCRVDDGVPAWVDSHRTKRLKALGNAIVPQVAYQIFKSLS